MGIARSTCYRASKGSADDTALVEAMHAIKDEFEAYGWESFKTVLSLTAYHSFVGEVEARSPPRYAALTLHPVTNFWP